MVKNTYQTFYRKYKNKEETEANKNLIWHWCLRDTPNDLFPIGKWQMYDSIGNIKAVINYEALPETKIISDNENVFYYNDDFYIVPNGECLIFNKRKKAKPITFKNGELIK